MNAGGGLLVGTVIKYADAVTKDVAIGASIVLSSVTSVQLFGFELDSAFVAGVCLVIYSVFLYGGRATCCGLLAA
jgi:UDP-sugar transporter A1/2/3